MSFANLKSSRGSSIDQLVKAAEAVTTKTETKSYADDRFWKPTQDKAGNGYAVIRFLPAKEGEDLPWVRYWHHGFKGPTGLWYIENSLTSIGQPDPVSESNGLLWNTGRDEDKQTARDRKRRLHYVSNIMVVSDSANPDAEGKVYLYKFGKKIFDKISEAMKPEFEDETPLNPFDFWEGVNFKLKIRQVEGYRNYDKSEFEATTTPVADSDDAIEAIWTKQYSLAEITDPKNFKSYEALQTKLQQVLGGRAVPAPAASVSSQTGDVEDDLFVKSNGATDPATTVESASTDDDALSYFSKLADED